MSFKGIRFEKLPKRSLLEKIQTICTKRSLMKRKVYTPPKIIGKDFQGYNYFFPQMILEYNWFGMDSQIVGLESL
jgi:hypothetical protein